MSARPPFPALLKRAGDLPVGSLDTQCPLFNHRQCWEYTTAAGLDLDLWEHMSASRASCHGRFLLAQKPDFESTEVFPYSQWCLSIWAIYSFSCRLRSPFCPALPCAERSDGKSQHGWTMPTLLSGQYLCHRSWALGSPCPALSLSQALRNCCEFTHMNPNSSSVDVLLVHTQHRFSNSPNRAVILPYSCNCRMKWKVIKGSFLLIVNRAVGISIERKISQQEYYYGGLWFRWSIYANYM